MHAKCRAPRIAVISVENEKSTTPSAHRSINAHRNDILSNADDGSPERNTHIPSIGNSTDCVSGTQSDSLNLNESNWKRNTICELHRESTFGFVQSSRINRESDTSVERESHESLNIIRSHVPSIRKWLPWLPHVDMATILANFVSLHHSRRFLRLFCFSFFRRFDLFLRTSSWLSFASQETICVRILLLCLCVTLAYRKNKSYYYCSCSWSIFISLLSLPSSLLSLHGRVVLARNSVHLAAAINQRDFFTCTMCDIEHKLMPCLPSPPLRVCGTCNIVRHTRKINGLWRHGQRRMESAIIELWGKKSIVHIFTHHQHQPIWENKIVSPILTKRAERFGQRRHRFTWPLSFSRLMDFIFEINSEFCLQRPVNVYVCWMRVCELTSVNHLRWTLPIFIVNGLFKWLTCKTNAYTPVTPRPGN